MKKKFNFLSFFVKVLEFTCFLVIILYVGFIVIQKFSNNSAIMGYRMFTVVSESMKPVYEIGDVIVVKEVDTTQLKVGYDIAYKGTKYEMADKIITHRIIKVKENNEFITQGIANDEADPVISGDQILGQVVTKLSFITFFSNIIRNQYGFYFLVFAPLVIIIFLEIVDTVHDIKGVKKDEEEA